MRVYRLAARKFPICVLKHPTFNRQQIESEANTHKQRCTGRLGAAQTRLCWCAAASRPYDERSSSRRREGKGRKHDEPATGSRRSNEQDDHKKRNSERNVATITITKRRNEAQQTLPFSFSFSPSFCSPSNSNQPSSIPIQSTSFQLQSKDHRRLT